MGETMGEIKGEIKGENMGELTHGSYLLRTPLRRCLISLY